MPWDVVDFDFGGEETTNFGPRKESGSALYHVDTLATISSSENDIRMVPDVRSSVQGDLACVAVESHLSVFKDCQHTGTLGFDAVVDEIEWSPDGSVVFLGLRSGKLYVIDSYSLNTLFDFTIQPASTKGRAFYRIVCQSRTDESFDLIILGKTGTMMVVRDLHGSMFTNDKEDKVKLAGEVKKKLTSVKTIQYHTEGVYDVVVGPNSILTLGGGESVAALWEWDISSHLCLMDTASSLFDSKDTSFIHGKISSDGNSLFVLGSNRSLSHWNPTLLIQLQRWTDFKVLEFQLLETKDLKNYSLEGVKLVMLVADNEEKVNLIIRSAPTYDVVYRLQLFAPSMLANCPVVQETLYVAECFPDEKCTCITSLPLEHFSPELHSIKYRKKCLKNFEGTVANVRFRCLTETNPETRLSRILYKNKFEEAVKFAKLYNLEMELVYKVKIFYLLDQLSPWNVRKYNEEKVEEMLKQIWECVEFVKDDVHLCDILIKSAFPELEHTERTLEYCKNRLSKACLSSTDVTVKEKLEVLIVKLQQVKDRMITYKMAYGKHSYSAEDWERFMEADLLEEALFNMRKSWTDSGITIWTRHESEWDEVMKPEMLYRFLSLIPDNMATMDVLTVMRDNIIPYTVRRLPEKLKEVVKWLIRWATKMELSDKDYWPGNALHFLRSIVRKMSSVLEIKESDVCCQLDIINKTTLNSNEILGPIQTLISSLQHLQDLLTKYKFDLTLDQFKQETTESVTFRMLDKVVAVELIHKTLEHQIRPYMREHNLKEDRIFSRYVKDLLERNGRFTSYIGGAPWEEKIIAVINCISDPLQKLTAILELVDYAPIPWTAEIERVVQNGLKLDHPMVRDLQKQVNMVRVKKLILKYGVNEVPDKDKCSTMAKYILRSDKPEAMEDALAVMEAFNMDLTVSLYLFRMRSLITEDKEECMNLLKNLPQSMAQNCCWRMIRFVELQINDTKNYDAEESQRWKRCLTDAGIAMIKFLIELTSDVKELKKLLFELEKIRILQAAFNMFPTLEQYRDRNYRRKMLIDYMKSVYSKSPTCASTKNVLLFCKIFNTRITQKRTYGKACCLAELLQISPAEMLGKLAIQAAMSGQIYRAIEMTSKLFEFDNTAQTAETLYEVALVFLKLYENIDIDSEESVKVNELRDLPLITHQLACQAMTICSPELQERCLQLANLTYLNLMVSDQCEAGEYSTNLETNDVLRSKSYQDMAMRWTADVVFKEDALVMNSRIVLPLVSAYAAAHSELYEQDPEEYGDPDLLLVNPLTRPAVLVDPIIQYLKDNSHHHLAYQFILQAFDIAAEGTWKRSYQQPKQANDMADHIAERTAEREHLNRIELKVQPTLRECTCNILMKIFNCTLVDHRTALAFVLGRSKKESFSLLLRIINSAGLNYKKIKALATVGIALATIVGERQAIDHCQKLEKNATWGHRLGKIKISFKDVFQEIDARKIDILPQIAQCEAASVNLVEDYCRTFSLSVNEGLMLYLDHVFEEMHQSYMYSSDLTLREIRMKNARLAVRAISEEDLLLEKLQTLYLKTSSYDYNTLEFLLEEMQKIKEEPIRGKKLKLLGYLKPYTRISEPTDYEIKYGGDRNKDDVQFQILPSLPSDSKTRLPLHPLVEGDPWRIISAELKKETVQKWLEIAKLLKLNPDQIYIMCVQSMVKKHISAVKKTDMADRGVGMDKVQWNWDAKDANTSLLVSVELLLQQVSNCETALACASWVVREMPIGAEKVLGLKGCLKMAKLWYEAAEDSAVKEKAKGAYLKFLSLWQRMATEQVLYSHDMAEGELLQSTKEGEKLINKLYEHPCIVDKSKEGIRPDIHSIVDEIGRIYSLDVDDIRMNLIKKWLPSSASSSRQSESESTMTFSFDALKLSCEKGGTAEDDDDDDNLQRVIYLLKKGNNEEIAAKITTYAFSNDLVGESQTVSNTCRVRAIRCLLQLGDDAVLHILGDKKLNTMDDLRYLLKITLYLVDLEKLHILQSVSTFEESNKEGLIKGIWRNHSHQRSACLLVSTLCLDYEIYDRQLWNNVLQQLLTFCMYNELEIILMRLQSVPEVWQVQAFPKVWLAILIHPLTTVVPPLGEDQLVQCLQVFSLLKKCPVLEDLDLQALSQHFHRLDMLACALQCLHLSKAGSDKEQEYISTHNTKILQSAQILQQHGLDSWDAVKTREIVFCYMLEHEDFTAIAQSQYKAPMVKFAIQMGSIDGLLKFSIMNNMFKEGDLLLKQYMTLYPDIEKQMDKFLQENYSVADESNYPVMKLYLLMRGLHNVADIL